MGERLMRRRVYDQFQRSEEPAAGCKAAPWTALIFFEEKYLAAGLENTMYRSQRLWEPFVEEHARANNVIERTLAEVGSEVLNQEGLD